MKFTTGVRSQNYTLSREEVKKRGVRKVSEDCYSQAPLDTGQDKSKIFQGYELISLLEKANASRIDDQRCVLPAYFNRMRECDSESWVHSVMGVLKWRKSSQESAPSATQNQQHLQQQQQQHLHLQHQLSYQSCRGGMMEERRETNAERGKQLLAKTLEGPGPYPTIVLPYGGGYWSDCGEVNLSLPPSNEHQPKTYRHHFLGQEHVNLTGWDDSQGPVLVSVKYEAVEDQTRVVLRLRTGTVHSLVPSTASPPLAIVKALKPELSLNTLDPVLCPRASHLIAAYDEHVLVSQYKFGVLYQKFGQTTEEDLFGNRTSSPAFDEFLNCLGRRVNLKSHRGYRGGLDTQFGQTGEEAVYQVYKETEMIFHVSTLLPFTDNDPQQLQRKRHIGNDIVAIVFQESNTPFSPDMVASHFLHAFIVVQAIDPHSANPRYKVCVTARDDVPVFGPPLPNPPIFHQGPELRDFLLEKLINAESACYKANKFAQLELRTRSSLLESLVNDLREKSKEFLYSAMPDTPTDFPETPKSESGSGNRFIDTVRKALIARVRSQENNNNNVKKMANGHSENDPCQSGNNTVTRSGTFGKKSSPSSPVSSPDIHTQRLNSRVSESDCSSLNSVELENGADSDTGLESMSSSENKTCSLCLEPADLAGEITRLKCDKLHLLRQNVTCQREIKRLRERELGLQSELAAASREILRLRELLKDYSTKDSAPTTL